MVDGHPDALDGETSPTGEAADMDLALVLGRGHPDLAGLAGGTPIVEPESVALIGHRPAGLDSDVAAELALVPEAVEQTTAPELRRRGAGRVAWATLAAGRGRPIWLHIDLDALDERELPAVSYPQPQGLSWAELAELLEPLIAAPDLAGVSLADLDADHPHARQHAGRIVDVLQSAFSGLR
jgi:arginase